MKIRQVWADLFHAGADGQTDRHDETNSLFRNFAKALNNIKIIV